MSWLLVLAGGMVGAPMRYLTDRAVQSRHDTVFPWGTLAVNVIGCLVLGVVARATIHGAAPASVQALVGMGFCAALTTYSTFSYETLRLAETGSQFLAAANVIVSVVAGLGAGFIGAAVAGAVWV